MSDFTQEELDLIIEKGWVMFDIGCKPTGTSLTTLYDPITGKYFNPGSGWKNDFKSTSGFLAKDTFDSETIRTVMMTDVSWATECNIFFFSSHLEKDEEVWEIVGLYAFKNLAALQDTKSGFYMTKGSIIKKVDIGELLFELTATNSSIDSDVPIQLVAHRDIEFKHVNTLTTYATLRGGSFLRTAT